MRDADAVVRNARRALRRASGQTRGRLHRAVDELTTTVQRARRVVTQTRTRLRGQVPDSATRLVSLHDPDARPISKGRLGKPEFGYKAQIIDNADGVILDHNVETGNPADAPQLAPAIERITRRTGHAPRAVTADRGYGEAGVERDLHALGVRSVAIPRKGKSGAARREVEHRRAPTSLPRQGQMANRIRRTNQPHQTQLRLEPHRTHHHHRRPNLVRTRRTRPQPGQDRRPDSMRNHTEPNHAHPNQSPAAHTSSSHNRHHDNRAFFRSK